MHRVVPQFSFGVVLVILTAATIVGVGLSIVFHREYLIPFVIGATVAVGVVYILVGGSPALEEAPTPGPSLTGTADLAAAPDAWSIAPVAPPVGSIAPPVGEPGADEPFYDPVEEADRLDSGRPPGGAAPSGSDDSK
jgi:hypothetical protein